jgi:hypothetical protein
VAGSVLKTGPKDREQNKTKKDGDETEFMQHSSRFALLSLYSDSRYLDMDLFPLFCTSKPETADLFFVVVVGFCFDECCQLSGVVQDGVKVDIESAQTTVVIETETNLID